MDGDGFSAYEEYRGFYVNGVHIRTSPEDKDVFVYDEDSLDNTGGAMQDFDESELRIHVISYDPYNPWRSDNVVNFRNGYAHNADQCGIKITAEDYYNDDPDAKESGLTIPWSIFAQQPFTPNDVSHVEVYTERIHDAYDSSDCYEQGLRHTIAHELGHAAGLVHHEPDWYGGPDCFMKYYHNEPDPFAWLNAIDYCTTGPDCHHQFRLH